MLFVAAFCLAFCFDAAAQQGDIRAFAGLGLGTNAGVDEDNFDSAMRLGLVLGGEYMITDDLSAAPSYEYYLPQDIGGVNYRTSSLNIDARYYFGQFYGLAGLSVASATAGDGNGNSVSASESGLNLGGGAMISMGDGMHLNLQAKYNTPLEQLALQAGVSFTF